MKSILNCYLIIIFSLNLAAVNVYAVDNTIYLHTENMRDLEGLQSLTAASVSSATNIAALGLIEEAEQSNIQLEYMTTKRTLNLMAEDRNICVINKIKTEERLKSFIFSRPVNLFLSRRLYQSLRSKEIPDNMLEQDGGVYLPDLFARRPNERMLVATQITYGDNLDKQISALPGKNKLERSSGEQDSGILAMFRKERAEFALFYPQLLFGSNADIAARSYAIASIPPYVVGHIMCTKNAVTEAFVDKLNWRIDNLINSGDMLRLHLEYINPSDINIFKTYFYQEF